MDYNGRTLSLSPVNVTLRNLAERIAAGTPTRVVLEPGDATRYEFLLVPLVGQMEHAGGYSPGCVAHVPCNLRMTGKFMAVNLDYDPGPYDFEGYGDGYTREVIASFYSLFRAAAHERVLAGHREPEIETLRRQAEAMA